MSNRLTRPEAEARLRLYGCEKPSDFSWAQPDRWRCPACPDDSAATLAYSEKEARAWFGELMKVDPATIVVEKF